MSRVAKFLAEEWSSAVGIVVDWSCGLVDEGMIAVVWQVESGCCVRWGCLCANDSNELLLYSQLPVHEWLLKGRERGREEGECGANI